MCVTMPPVPSGPLTFHLIGSISLAHSERRRNRPSDCLPALLSNHLQFSRPDAFDHLMTPNYVTAHNVRFLRGQVAAVCRLPR